MLVIYVSSNFALSNPIVYSNSKFCSLEQICLVTRIKFSMFTQE